MCDFFIAINCDLGCYLPTFCLCDNALVLQTENRLTDGQTTYDENSRTCNVELFGRGRSSLPSILVIQHNQVCDAETDVYGQWKLVPSLDSQAAVNPSCRTVHNIAVIGVAENQE